MGICEEEGCDNPKRIHSDGRERARCYGCQNNMYSYGITTPQRNAMLRAQHGKCKVCEENIKFYRDGPMKFRACIDHCHETGRIRGVLCSTCNIVLGKLNDNALRLRALANYLEEN